MLLEVYRSWGHIYGSLQFSLDKSRMTQFKSWNIVLQYSGISLIRTPPGPSWLSVSNYNWFQNICPDKWDFTVIKTSHNSAHGGIYTRLPRTSKQTYTKLQTTKWETHSTYSILYFKNSYLYVGGLFVLIFVLQCCNF